MRARDRREGTPAYEQWRIERQKEINAENAAAQAAAAQSPVALYTATANAEAEHNRQLVLSGVLNDEYLQSFGTIVRQPFTEAQVETAMAQFMAETPDYIRTNPNAKVLIEFIWRNNISPAACDSYRIAHKLLTLWNGYADEVAPQVEAEVVPVVPVEVDTRTPSQKAAQKYQDDHTIIAVTDPDNGRQYTEYDLSQLNAVDERRLRRIAEKGNPFGSVYEGYLDIKNTQHVRDQDIAARAAAEAHEEGQ